jgi:ribosomal protein S18 acetylase RimI-like enzyme
MTSPIALRPAQAADLDALIALEQHCFAGDRLSRRSFRRWLGQASGGLMVADTGAGALAGYVLVILRNNSPLARLYSIATHSDFRGQGLGARLVGAAETYASQHRRRYLRLEVRSDNRAAIRLYERLGYTQFDCLTDYYQDHEDALRFQKPL